MFDLYDDYCDMVDMAERQEVRCRFCRERYLHWEETLDGWRLFDEDGEMHNCRQQSASVDDFEDET